MKKSLFLLLLGCLFMSAQVMAQMTVTGTVTDGDGETLIGVNIVEKGTTNGTVTDLDGNYSILVANDATLVFSYVGFGSKDVPVTSSTVDVVMEESTILDEVVVSALAIERNSREVVYANQTINSEDLLSSPSTGGLVALQGKLAGVKITGGSGTVGASTKVVLRGESSISFGNNALIVVDGIPIDNSSLQGGEGSEFDGFVDFGSRGNDINPQDIESVTVLKGPAATSLYGSRGRNGVIMYTTKKGSGDKKFKVGLSTSTTIEKAYIQLKRQDQFGQGYATCDCDPNDLWSGENFAWGLPVDDVVRPWTSPVLVDTDGDGVRDEYQWLSKPYSAIEDQLDDFFNLGRTTQTSVNFSGGNEKYSYYASYTNTDQRGILDPGELKKNQFSMNATAKFSDKVRSNAGIKVAYTNVRGISEGNTFSSGIPNGYFFAVQTPIDIPFDEIRDYTSPFHGFEGYYGSFTINPYFILNESSLTNQTSNILGNYDLTVTPIEGLDITGRIGINLVNSVTEEKLPVFQYEDHFVWVNNQQLEEYTGRDNSAGLYRNSNSTAANMDIVGQASYSKSFGQSDDYSISVLAGYNFFQRQTERLTGTTTGGLVVPELYTLANSAQSPLATQRRTKYRLYGVYGSASFGFRDFLFLEYNARNDWSSTLPIENNNYFYHSGGVSFIASELIPTNNALSYLKIRGNVGSSGDDGGLYLTSSDVYIPISTFQDQGDPDHNILAPLNGEALFTQSNQLGNIELEPELTVTYEAGVDLSLYRNRISAEYTFYNENSSNLIVPVSVASSSGFTTSVQNIGEVLNRGHELSVSINPLPRSVKDVKLKLNWNFAKNKSEVLKASDNSDEVTIGGFGGFGGSGTVAIVAKEGMEYGAWKALVFKTDPSGNMVVNASGIPEVSDEQEFTGTSYQPDFTTNFGANLSWKGLSASILFDVKKGGEFYSFTKSLSEFNGTASVTTLNNREDFFIEGSVQEVDNGDGTVSYVENTEMTGVYDYFNNLPGGEHIIDASYIKLRELGVSYTLPAKLFKDSPLSDVTIGFIAKNLKYWLGDENTFADPEVLGVGGTGNAVGSESHATPTSRSYGFRVNVNF